MKLGRFPAAVLAIAGAAACAAPASAPQPAARREQAKPIEALLYPSFPSVVETPEFTARARYSPDEVVVFGARLAQEEFVLPIALTLSAREPSTEIALESLRLVLPDGSVLRPRAAQDIHTASEFTEGRLRALALRSGPLAAEERYVYFALEPREQFHVRESEVARRVHDVVHTMDLSGALIATELRTPSGTRPVRLGIAVEERR